MIRKNNSGRVASDDPKAFAEGIMELVNSPDELVDCGVRGIKLIRNVYNKDFSAKLLVVNCKKLV